ncbi:mitochondrial ATPase complex subunit ATP10 [Citrus sinensis]|nr:mitochondrial ATPase complex subunit ATP10 [Citrus sinensis]
MFRINRLINQTRASLITSKQLLTHEHKLFPQHYAQKSSTRFLDIYQLGNKQAVEKERARLADEMNRGYFADVAELKKHGGKIATANKIIIPALAAVKFPDLDVSYSDGTPLKLPVCSSGDVANADKAAIPKVSLVCLTFRASSQVSFIDSWLLCRSPIKRILLKIMRKSKDAGENVLQRQIVYSFGDHYYFRKELKILNLLTGYFFLLDKFGRIRWQGFGMATPEELSSLLSCTSLLLEGE